MLVLDKFKFSRRVFLSTSGLVLLITGIAKLTTLFGETTLLTVSDPIFGFQFRTLMLGVGVAEIVIAAICFLSNKEEIAVLCVAWIASGFLAYRIVIKTMDWKRPCGCLGNLTDVLGLSPQAVDWAAVGLLGYLLVGSFTMLLTQVFSEANEKGVSCLRGS